MARVGQQLKMMALVLAYLAEQEDGGYFVYNSTRTYTLQRFATSWDEASPFRPAQSLTKRDIELWFTTYRKKDGTPLSPYTRRCYAAHIKAFVEWGIGTEDFKPECIRFKAGKVSSKSTSKKTWLEKDFLQEIWEAEQPYFRGLLSFTAYTLARGNEIVSLQVKDLLSPTRVNLSRPKVNDYDDRLPIVKALQPELQRYMAWYQNKVAVGTRKIPGRALRGTDYLFPKFGNGYGGPVDGWVNPEQQRDTLWQPCKRIILKHIDGPPPAGLGGHTLRRSMARDLYDTLIAADVIDAMRVVQGMLGHTDITHTQIYIGMASVIQVRDNVMDKLDWGSTKKENVLHLPTKMPWETEDNPFATTKELALAN